MDPFYAFLIFAGLLSLEYLASQAWVAPYFNLGIPVFYSTAHTNQPVDTIQAAEKLQERMAANMIHPTVQFKTIGSNQIALREKLFENHNGIRYLPVMHSLIRLHPVENSASITGYINWTVLAVLIYLVIRSASDPSFIPVAGLVVLIFIFSYWVQTGIAKHIHKDLAHLPQTAQENTV